MKMVEHQINKLPGLESLPDEITIPGLSEPNDFVPKKDPNCVFPIETFRILAGFFASERPGGLLIRGPSGSGKSYLTRQFHAYTNRPMFYGTGYKTLEYEDLMATKEIVDGDTVAISGPLLQAVEMASAGMATFLFEEIDRAPSATSVALNPVLDGYPIINTLDGGRRIEQSPGFKIVATANTAGYGDVTGEFNSAVVMDESVLRRFWCHVHWYVDPDMEFQVLRRAVDPQYEDENLRKSIAFANDVRYLHAGRDNEASASAQGDAGRDAIHTTISTDTLLQFWHVMEIFSGVPNPIEHALKLVLTNKCTPECAEVIHRLADAQFAGDI